jgi:7,8-dihydro-6-hydroxymethylpterin dimethyltransferase
VNLTGGEPTQHPGLLELVAEARRPAIGRVTVNSNGLRLSRDPELCAALARAGAYVILSFDTLRPAVAVRIHGRDVVEAKRAALRNLGAAGVGTTLLHVLIPGVNETEFGDVLDLALAHEHVRNITVQTMTYTGLGGGGFEPRLHLPLDRAARWIEEATRGRIRRASFRPLPAAHARCYQVAYFFRWRGALHDLFGILDPAAVDDLFEGGYLLCPGDRAQEAFRSGLDRLWAEGREPGLLEGFKALVRELHPGRGPVRDAEAARRVGEKYFFAVYLHAHMDEDNLDLARLKSCPDQVPDAEGRLVSACAYNLFYRRNDPRFWIDEAGCGGA